MKKLILFGAFFLLAGCKESETGLQKNVVNTAYQTCYNNLSKVVKSPSSLVIRDSYLDTYMPYTSDIYRVFGDGLIKDGRITDLSKRVKTRFRGIGVRLEYEAQNSFGVYLPGGFECSFMYELISDNTSPDSMRLISISAGNGKVDLNKSIFNIKDASNIRLTNKINKIYGVPNDFNKEDESQYIKLIDYHNSTL